MKDVAEHVTRIGIILPLLREATARNDYAHIHWRAGQILEECVQAMGIAKAQDYEKALIKHLDEWIANRKAEIAALAPVEDE